MPSTAAVASVVSDSATLQTAAHHAPLSLGFSRQEYWSGLPFPSPLCSPWGRKESDMTEASLNACMHWRRKWLPTPVFLPGESQGQRSVVGCRL